MCYPTLPLQQPRRTISRTRRTPLTKRPATSDEVKALPYLQACINEGLRLHSTSALGLPRVVPEGGMAVLGAFFPAGTVVSVPSYTIHRDEEIWGADVEAFRPERWFDEERKDRMAWRVLSERLLGELIEVILEYT